MTWGTASLHTWAGVIRDKTHAKFPASRLNAIKDMCKISFSYIQQFLFKKVYIIKKRNRSSIKILKNNITICIGQIRIIGIILITLTSVLYLAK